MSCLRIAALINQYSFAVIEASLQSFEETFAPYGLEKDRIGVCYGQAESTVYITGSAGGPRRTYGPNQFCSCGSCPSDTDVVIVDPETLAQREDGQEGEVWVRSPAVAAGYLNRPAETAETFDATALLLTGYGFVVRVLEVV